MLINLGANVLASDGDKVGSVSRIVLDSNTKTIHRFIVDRGMFSTEHRMVDVEMVSSADDDNVRLNLTHDQVDELPNFVEERFSHVPDTDYNQLPYAMPSASGTYLYGAPFMGRGYEGSHDSVFDAAPSTAPIVEDRSNLMETDVMISEGTDVYGADGEKVGKVDEIVMGNGGEVRGFLVKSGFIFTKDVRIPIDLVDNAGEDRITLNVSSAEAETRSFDIEDTTL